MAAAFVIPAALRPPLTAPRGEQGRPVVHLPALAKCLLILAHAPGLFLAALGGPAFKHLSARRFAQAAIGANERSPELFFNDIDPR